MNEDKINPSYYNMQTFQVIDVIKMATEDCKGVESVCTGNAIKYLCRWKKKNGLEDLKKARWYLHYLITTLEGE